MQGFASDIDLIVADNLLELKNELEAMIGDIVGGGDPGVITAIQADIAAIESTLGTMGTTLSGKATTGYVDSAVAGKADTSDVNASLATKANTSYVDSELALKAGASATTSALAGKVSQATYDAFVSANATALIGKAAASDLTALTGTVSTNSGAITTLTSGLAAKLNKVGDTANVAPTELQIKVVRVGDATATSGWKNLFELWYTPNGGTSRIVGWYNEFGEWRGMPGNTNTVPWRLFVKDLIADADHTGNMMEVTDHREGTRTALFAVDSSGNIMTLGNVTAGGNVVATGTVTGSNIGKPIKGAYSAAPSTAGWAADSFWWLTTGETTLP